jgi:hypothetical protein
LSESKRGEAFMKLRTATVIGLLTLALPALAQKPTITLIPATPFTVTGGPANGACTFDVSVVPQANRPNGERLILFANTAVVAGPLFVTFTNLSDPTKTLSLNASGPGIINFSANEETLLGPSFISGFRPDITEAAGLPAVALLTGRTVITADSLGNVTSITHVGTVKDICQALQ